MRFSLLNDASNPANQKCMQIERLNPKNTFWCVLRTVGSGHWTACSLNQSAWNPFQERPEVTSAEAARRQIPPWPLCWVYRKVKTMCMNAKHSFNGHMSFSVKHSLTLWKSRALYIYPRFSYLYAMAGFSRNAHNNILFSGLFSGFICGFLLFLSVEWSLTHFHKEMCFTSQFFCKYSEFFIHMYQH